MLVKPPNKLVGLTLLVSALLRPLMGPIITMHVSSLVPTETILVSDSLVATPLGLMTRVLHSTGVKNNIKK